MINHVPDDARMVGIPATPEREQMLKQVAWAKLPEMRKEFKALQSTVAELVQQTAPSAAGPQSAKDDPPCAG